MTFNFNSDFSTIYTNINHTGKKAIISCLDDGVNIDTDFIKGILSQGLLGFADVRHIEIYSTDDIYRLTENFKHRNTQMLVVRIHDDKLIFSDVEHIFRVVGDVVDRRAEMLLSTFVFATPNAISVDQGDFHHYLCHHSGVFSEMRMNDVEIKHKDLLNLFSRTAMDETPLKYVGFLDIDETLLTERTFMRTGWAGTHCGEFLKDPISAVNAFDKEALSFLKKLSKMVGVKWVLSSQWRCGIGKDNAIHLGRYLGLPIIDITPITGDRSNEIAQWLSEHQEVEKSFILDNEEVIVPGVAMIKVSPKEGLTVSKAQDICTVFDQDVRDIMHYRLSRDLT